MDKIEDYIWDKVDEKEFLRRVIEDDHLDDGALLEKVQGIQENLNTQLRKGVEENYPRLLELVGAIESLDSMQANFSEEMNAVAKRADHLGNTFTDYYEKIRHDVISIENLTKLRRLLNDGSSCESLIQKWHQEKDLLRQAELIHELNSIIKDNDKLKKVKWMNDNFLHKLPQISSQTRSEVVAQLKTAVQTLNASQVSSNLKALSLLLEPHAKQKELNEILDEAIKELDGLFLQLGAQPTIEKGSKLLPQLGHRLHSQLEQFQLLGPDNAQAFARRVGKAIINRVPANAPFAMRLVQTVGKCLLTHNESVAKPIRDALGPLKTSILSQSLANLFAMVDETFDQEEKKAAIIVEKLTMSMKGELASVNWDSELQKEMEASLVKCLKYIGVKVEQQIHLNEETLRLSGRVSKAQSANYQMLSVAHAFSRQWPAFASSLRTVIDPNVQTIVQTMKATVSLVLASMHDENLHSSMGGTSASLYMKELCDHLKVFRTHANQIQPLADSLEELPNFLNFVIEQFLLHISLVRPITEKCIERFSKDLEFLARNGLQIFNCKSSKYLNAYRQIIDFIRRPLSTLQDPDSIPKTIPLWLPAHLLISDSDTQLLLPHESAGWTRAEYVFWFNEHSEVERYRFLSNLMSSYNQSVIAKGATEYVPHYPVIMKLIEHALSTLQ
uniref:Conserved oligomeric Golgi complex subunit 5 n=1 Tax=Acrobeloides nanus TaxID=290746 RepID=A0A914BUW8_9BILA